MKKLLVILSVCVCVSVTAYAEDSGEVTYIEEEQSYSDTTPNSEEQDGSNSSEPSEPLEDEETEEDEEDIPEDTSLNEKTVTDEELQHYKDVAAIRYYMEIFGFGVFPIYIAVRLIYIAGKWFEGTFIDSAFENQVSVFNRPFK